MNAIATMHTENTVTSLLRTAVDERVGSMCAMTESVEVIIASMLSFITQVISAKCLLDSGHEERNVQRLRARV